MVIYLFSLCIVLSENLRRKMDHNSTQEDTFCTLYNTINLTDPAVAADWIINTTDKILNLYLTPFLCAIGIIGNFAFLFSIFRIRSMQTSLNMFTRNLAVADATYLIIVIYWTVMDYTRSDVKNDSLGTAIECGLFAVIVHTSYFASLGFITMISIERYLAVCSPIKHVAMKSKKRTLRLTCVVWVIALIIGTSYVPQFTFMELCLEWPPLEDFDSLPTKFHACLPLHMYVTVYTALITIVSFFLALIVNSTIYIRIVYTLSNRSVGSTNQRHDMIRNQVTRTLIINGILCFICQLPYRLVTVSNLLVTISPYTLFSEEVYYTVHNIGIVFFILNSCINPYLYVMGSRQYRNAMRDAFLATFCRRAITEDSMTENNNAACADKQSSTSGPSAISKSTTDSPRL